MGREEVVHETLSIGASSFARDLEERKCLRLPG